MTKTRQNGAAPMQTSELYNQWLHILMHYAKYFADQDCLWDRFSAHDSGLRHFFENKSLPFAGDHDYVSVSEGMARCLNDFVKTAPDHRKAAGAVLWRFIRAVHPDMRNNTIQNKTKKPEAYRKERRFQKNMMQILGHAGMELSAKDKINALDYLEYKYSASEYRQVYRQLGDYNFGESAADFDYERVQTVKLFHELLKHSRKSTYKDKIISAQTFLETVARNGQLLENVHYADVYGNTYTIDAAAKAEMLAGMKKAKVAFSPECIAYFEGQQPLKQKITPYLAALLRKIKMATPQQKGPLLARSFAQVNLQLQQQKNVTAQLVDFYSDYLSQYASYYFDNASVRTDLLENLIIRKSETDNIRQKAENLFPDLLVKKEREQIDKNLVLTVAQNYAKSFTVSDYQGEEFNPAFHERMTQMLSKFVTTYPYQKSEVQALCATLQKNPDWEMKQMSQNIMRAYTTRPLSRDVYQR